MHTIYAIYQLYRVSKTGSTLDHESMFTSESVKRTCLFILLFDFYISAFRVTEYFNVVVIVPRVFTIVARGPRGSFVVTSVTAGPVVVSSSGIRWSLRMPRGRRVVASHPRGSMVDLRRPCRCTRVVLVGPCRSGGGGEGCQWICVVYVIVDDPSQ